MNQGQLEVVKQEMARVNIHILGPGSSVHGISRREYWSGLPFPPPRDLPDPGIKSASLMPHALIGRQALYH